MPDELKKLAHYLIAHKPDYATEDTESITDILYLFYAECYTIDSPAIRESYRALDAHVEHLSPQEQDAISDILCDLCTEHEKEAFTHGIKLGARLIRETGG